MGRTVLAAFAILLAGLAIGSSPAGAQAPLYQYAVKFVCGASDGKVVAPGKYWTAINVGNPTSKGVALRKRFSVALPGEKPGPVSPFFDARLGPYQAFEIDNADIQERTESATRFVKGFVFIESRTPLDIVAVYTVLGQSGQVALEVERPPARALGREIRLADLLPVHPHEAGLYQLDERGQLVITIKNQGQVAAPASQTKVTFDSGNPPPAAVTLATPPIPAGGSVQLPVKVPPGGFTPDLKFTITADSANQVTESNEANNTAHGVSLG